MSLLTLLMIFWCAFFGLVGRVMAQEFYVSNTIEFQAALNEARANGEDDVIYLAPGTYDVDTVPDEEKDCPNPPEGIHPYLPETGYGLCYVAAENEDYALRIVGENPEETIITSSSRSRSLLFLAAGTHRHPEGGYEVVNGLPNAHLSLEGITFHGGRFEAPEGYTCSGAGGLTVISTGAVTVRNCRFEENEAFGSRTVGGAVLASSVSEVVLENSYFRNNKAFWRGGALLASQGGEITFRQNIFEGNEGFTGGAAVFSTMGEVLVEENLFENNRGSWGGGLSLFFPPAENTSLSVTLRRNIFYGNEASFREGVYRSGQGGGLKIGNNLSQAQIVLEENTFEGNYSGQNGAGATLIDTSAEGAFFEIRGNNFYGNTVSAGGDIPYDARGGGLFVYSQNGTNLALSGNTFEGNVVEGDFAGKRLGITGGGACFSGNFSSFELRQNRFFGNRLQGEAQRLEGGGFHFWSPGVPEIIVQGNILNGNHVEGTAAYASGGGFHLLLAGSQGPLTAAGKIEIEENSILNNYAAKYQGAFLIHLVPTSSDVLPRIYFRNNVVAGNRADESTAGGYIENIGQIIAVHNTFFENFQGDQFGSSLVLRSFGEAAEIHVYHNIFWHGGLWIDPDGDQNGESAPVHIVKNLFEWNLPADWASNPAFEIRDNLFGQEPHFVDPTTNDFHLAEGSPAIDAGEATLPFLPEKDFEGDPRVVGEAPDLGADERNIRPQLKVNGSQTPDVLSPYDLLEISVSLDPAGRSGTGDYFLWAQIPGGACYCYTYPSQWRPCSCNEPTPAYQGGLVRFSDLLVAQVPCQGLLRGEYTLWFAVDTLMNGVLDPEAVRDEVGFEIR